MMIYGTAWKGDRTASLVKLALEAGFRGVDVAAQPRHYREDLVGEGLRATWSEGKLSRGEIYVCKMMYYYHIPQVHQAHHTVMMS